MKYSKLLVNSILVSLITTGCTAEFQNAVSTLAKTINTEIASLAEESETSPLNEQDFSGQRAVQNSPLMPHKRRKPLRLQPELAQELEVIKGLPEDERESRLQELKEKYPNFQQPPLNFNRKNRKGKKGPSHWKNQQKN